MLYGYNKNVTHLNINGLIHLRTKNTCIPINFSNSLATITLDGFKQAFNLLMLYKHLRRSFPEIVLYQNALQVNVLSKNMVLNALGRWACAVLNKRK